MKDNLSSWYNIMSIDYVKLYTEISDNNQKSKQQASKYENKECWSIAWLCRWVVLENGLKRLCEAHNRERIRSSAKEWLDYLDNPANTVPKSRTNFQIKELRIPAYARIKEMVGDCGKIEQLSSEKKYRNRRNNIAHYADDSMKETTYRDYRNCVDSAIKQLISKLHTKAGTKSKGYPL
jgi:hypothetical protein